MNRTPTLPPPSHALHRRGRRSVPKARFAVYAHPTEPPLVEAVEAEDESALIEALFERAAGASRLPVLAVREVVENLVHAGFDGALVSVLHGGCCVRVSDRGPGIRDKELAMEPGYTSACERVRGVVRGVGSGLPVAAGAIAAVGGTLALADNLGGGTVATLEAPGETRPAQSELGETARRLLALLVELSPTAPAALAGELGLKVGECGRELVLLEHRGFVTRAADGRRSLTPAGSDLITTLF